MNTIQAIDELMAKTYEELLVASSMEEESRLEHIYGALMTVKNLFIDGGYFEDVPDGRRKETS